MTWQQEVNMQLEIIVGKMYSVMCIIDASIIQTIKWVKYGWSSKIACNEMD